MNKLIILPPVKVYVTTLEFRECYRCSAVYIHFPSILVFSLVYVK